MAKEASKSSEIADMEAQLAENRKATKNIMVAIEQGIFTATTKDRLLELEADIASLESSIKAAKAISEGRMLEKERIIYSLEKLRNGNAHSKTYQKQLIDTFVRAVYLWDDRIGIDYYYAGKNCIEQYSLSELLSGCDGDIEVYGGAEGVLTNSPKPHQKEALESQ